MKHSLGIKTNLTSLIIVGLDPIGSISPRKSAIRGSGGVGAFIKQSLLKSYSVNILDDSLDDVLWLNFTSFNEGKEDLVLCVLFASCWV